MYTNRRSRQQMKKTTYSNNQLSQILQPNGAMETLIKDDQDEHVWKKTGNNVYNTNVGNIGIGKQTPLSELDVSGSINTTTQYTINYISIAPPIGSIMAYTVAVSPSGWLLCDGASLNRIVYAGLFGVIGTTFGGVGGGDLSFNLPNYGGAFLRGIGTNNGYVGPSNISTYQPHATQTHSHSATSIVSDNGHNHIQSSHTHGANTSIIDPGHVHSQTTTNDDYNNSGGNNYPNSNSPSFAGWDSAGSKTWTNINSTTTGITASTTLTSTTPSILNSTTGVTVSTSVANSTTSVNANETRPYKYGVYWIIKF